MFFIAQVVFVFVVHSSTCHNLDVEYIKRVVSDHTADAFGVSLATSHQKLVVGAPLDDNNRGSVLVDEGVRVKGPEDGRAFGLHVDVNQQFMVVSGYQPYFVYVYQSHSPYDIVARFPMGGDVYALVISDDNTIAVFHYDDNNHGNWLTIYQYDGSSTWNIVQNFELEGPGDSLAVYGDIIVVGFSWFSDEQGLDEQGQTIKQDGVEYFGWSISIHDRHMGVSTKRGFVFTYMLDQHTNTWINNGKLSAPGGWTPYVSIQNEVLVITVNDMDHHPDVCGIVYKLTSTTTTTTTSNNNNNSNSNKNNINNNNNIWVEIAQLTTKGDLMTSDEQLHWAVSIEGSTVFTGRFDGRDEGVGEVFLHELPDYNNGEN